MPPSDVKLIASRPEPGPDLGRRRFRQMREYMAGLRYERSYDPGIHFPNEPYALFGGPCNEQAIRPLQEIGVAMPDDGLAGLGRLVIADQVPPYRLRYRQRGYAFDLYRAAPCSGCNHRCVAGKGALACLQADAA